MESKILITGGSGQLGKALSAQYPNAQATDVQELDITDSSSINDFDWSNVSTIVNAAAYTDVDGAETAQGRVAAWQVNAQAVANLIKIAAQKDLTIVHISTDYVFDGTRNPHTENEPFSPLNVYGASKAAGDLILKQALKYYLLRTSWLIGDGKNFVRTMLELGQKGINPTVVGDQIGRPTFTSELVRVIDYLLRGSASFGTYNASNGGDPVSWAGLTREIFRLASYNNLVTDTTTADYYKDQPNTAKRPLNSILDLSKLEATGFKPTDWHTDLVEYVQKEMPK